MAEIDHEAQIQAIEGNALRITQQSPQNYLDVFSGLEKLREGEDQAKFGQDLTEINTRLHEQGWLPSMEIAKAPNDGFQLRPLNSVESIESRAEEIFTQNPQNYQEIFKDLDRLRQSESPQQFAKDLAAINLRLHDDGWLPGMEIVLTPQGSFLLMRQSGPQWNEEEQQRERQYNDPHYAAPRPTASPEGYNSGYSPQEGASHKGGYAPKAHYDPHAQGKPGNFRYDPKVSGNAAERILQHTQNDVGRQMWRETDHGASGAREGCAASVSAVLREAGVSHVNEMECHRLQAALQKEGWTVTSRPSPGDVVFGYGGLSSAHTGIVGANSRVFDNHSSTGQWSSDSLNYFERWNKQVFLHPPQGSDSKAPA